MKRINREQVQLNWPYHALPKNPWKLPGLTPAVKANQKIDMKPKMDQTNHPHLGPLQGLGESTWTGQLSHTKW